MVTKFSINEEFFGYDSIKDALRDAKNKGMSLPITVYEQEFKGENLSELIDVGGCSRYISRSNGLVFARRIKPR